MPDNPPARLAILICHLAGRKALLQRLLDRLAPQTSPAIRILIEDNGEQTTGAKRNTLPRGAHARGIPYAAFVDDDDLVAEDYCPRILRALEENPDVVGFEGLLIRRNGVCADGEKSNPETFIHSLRYGTWFETGPLGDRTYYRCPNHLNPVRTELALATGFPDLTRGEDRDYSNRLRPLLKTESFLDGALYYYFCN